MFLFAKQKFEDHSWSIKPIYQGLNDIQKQRYEIYTQIALKDLSSEQMSGQYCICLNITITRIILHTRYRRDIDALSASQNEININQANDPCNCPVPLGVLLDASSSLDQN